MPADVSFSLLLVASLLGGSPDVSAAVIPVSAVGQYDGATLVVHIARSVYPRNAVVRVEMIVRNTSRHPIWRGVTQGYDCGSVAPLVRVMSDSTQVYPPAVVQSAAPSCAPPPLGARRLLGPHRTMTNSSYAILRGTLLTADVTLVSGGKSIDLMARPLTIKLTRPNPPRVQRLDPKTDGRLDRRPNVREISRLLDNPATDDGGGVRDRLAVGNQGRCPSGRAG